MLILHSVIECMRCAHEIAIFYNYLFQISKNQEIPKKYILLRALFKSQHTTRAIAAIASAATRGLSYSLLSFFNVLPIIRSFDASYLNLCNIEFDYLKPNALGYIPHIS